MFRSTNGCRYIHRAIYIYIHIAHVAVRDFKWNFSYIVSCLLMTKYLLTIVSDTAWIAAVHTVGEL